MTIFESKESRAKGPSIVRLIFAIFVPDSCSECSKRRKRFMPILNSSVNHHTLRGTCKNLDLIGNSGGEQSAPLRISAFLCASGVKDNLTAEAQRNAEMKSNRLSYNRSTIIAMPCPPPMHAVAKP